jgi:hypothetical protein
MRTLLAGPLGFFLALHAFQDAPPPPPPAEAAEEPVPEPERGLRTRAEGACEGYTLFAPLRSGTTYLVDMDGEVVHRWESEHAPGASVYLLANGNLLRCARYDDNPVFHGGGIGGRLQEIDWDGNVVWDFVLSDERLALHHDVEPLPNGNLLAIAWESLTREQALALGRDPEVLDEEGLWPDVVLEIEPVRPADGTSKSTAGKIVWEWHAKDHLVQDRDPQKPGFGEVPAHPGRIDVNGDHRDRPPETEEERERREEREARMRAVGYVGGEDEPDGDGKDARPRRRGRADWLHTNSVDYDPAHDLVLLSTPRMNEVWVIDHSTSSAEAAGSKGGRWGRGGELLWRWGHPRTYGAGTDGDQRLFAQHDAQWIPPGHPGAGHVLVFNNGMGRPGTEHSSVDELVPPFDPSRGFARDPGTAYGPRMHAWTYSAPDPADFYSFFISGCQRLPNGNTLVCSGAQGRLFEVTPEGAIVWEYWNPHGGEIEASFGKAEKEKVPPVDPKAVFRATRIAPDHPALAERLGG